MKDFVITDKIFCDKKMIYLDSAAMTFTPKCVVEAMEEYNNNYKANVHRASHSLSLEATEHYENARNKVADFIGAKPEEIIFTKNSTEGLNLLAYSLDIKEGDEIVISVEEHHSNFVPWQQIAKKKGAVLKFIELDENGILDIKSAKKLITPKTKIVSVSHVSNVMGVINPVKEIGKIVHENNSLFIVDAAQSAAHLLVDVKDMGCDYLVFSGYKICGPTGIGVLYGKINLLEELDPFMFGGEMIEKVSFEETTFNISPLKFEAGTPPITEAIGLGRAVEYVKGLGVDKVHELTEYAVNELEKIPGLKVFGKGRRTGLISFVIEPFHSADIAVILDAQGVKLREGNHCAMPLLEYLKVKSVLRASLYIYNKKEDVDELIKGLIEATKLLGEKNA